MGLRNRSSTSNKSIVLQNDEFNFQIDTEQVQYKKRPNKLYSLLLFTVIVTVIVLASYYSYKLYIFYNSYGIGYPFEGYSKYDEFHSSTGCLLDNSSSSFDIIAELPYPPGKIAVSYSGKIFFTFTPEFYKGNDDQTKGIN